MVAQRICTGARNQRADNGKFTVVEPACPESLKSLKVVALKPVLPHVYFVSSSLSTCLKYFMRIVHTTVRFQYDCLIAFYAVRMFV